MPLSLVKNYVHIIFSTKHRKPLIDKEIQGELFSYLGGICKNLDCTPVIISGHWDHIHMLTLLSKKVAIVKLLEETKSHSSKWMKTKGGKHSDFYWQNGYGAFSVNPSQVEVVKKYIANQEEHHAKRTFQEEYRMFLKKYNVEYDERYVWD